MKTWAEVNVHDLVEGSNHSIWAVTARDGNRVTLQHAVSGKVVESTVEPTKVVNVVVSAADTAEAAEALVQVKLGGESIARRNETGLLMAPVAFAHIGSLLSHMYVFHYRHWFEATTFETAVAEHHRLHENGFKAFEEHVHDPDYLKGRVPV